MLKRGFRFNHRGTINCDVDHPRFDWIPTTLSTKESKVIIDSGAEIAPYIEPVKTLDDIRHERDLLLNANVDIYNPIRWAELSTTQKDSVKSYRKELLDITKQDPANVTWPAPPSI